MTDIPKNPPNTVILVYAVARSLSGLSTVLKGPGQKAPAKTPTQGPGPHSKGGKPGGKK